MHCLPIDEGVPDEGRTNARIPERILEGTELLRDPKVLNLDPRQWQVPANNSVGSTITFSKGMWIPRDVLWQAKRGRKLSTVSSSGAIHVT